MPVYDPDKRGPLAVSAPLQDWASTAVSMCLSGRHQATTKDFRHGCIASLVIPAYLINLIDQLLKWTHLMLDRMVMIPAPTWLLWIHSLISPLARLVGTVKSVAFGVELPTGCFRVIMSLPPLQTPPNNFSKALHWLRAFCQSVHHHESSCLFSPFSPYATFSTTRLGSRDSAHRQGFSLAPICERLF
jgi:hypothetical protein